MTDYEKMTSEYYTGKPVALVVVIVAGFLSMNGAFTKLAVLIINKIMQ